MENDPVFDQMIQLLGQIVTATSPEWTMEFLQGGVKAAMQAGGAEQMPPEAMGQPAPQAMPPAAPGRGMMGRKIN
jgi:hypothetical protein